jgi:hypothetical protein
VYERPAIRKTGLKQKLKWYCENYGLSLSTVCRHKPLLDNPEYLLIELYSSSAREADVSKLVQFLRKNRPNKS